MKVTGSSIGRFIVVKIEVAPRFCRKVWTHFETVRILLIKALYARDVAVNISMGR